MTSHFWSRVGVPLFSLFLALLPVGTALSAGAASLELEPASVGAEVGDRFTVTIRANPNGEEIDTVRAFLSFTPGVLVAENMEIGSLWSRTSPGNVIDNGHGTVSFGGFSLSGPVTQSGTFGTVTFRVAKSGTATVDLLGTSRLIAGGEEKSDGGSDTVAVNAATRPDKVPGVAYVTVMSPTHPDENAWYSAKEAAVSWTVEEDGQPVTGFYTAWDQNPDTDPTSPTSPTSQTSQTSSATSDGIWYFHLKAKQADGRYSNTAHFKIQIDTTAPNPIAPEFSEFQINENETTELNFGTTDEMSGIRGYELSISGGSYFPATSPYRFEGLDPGTYLVSVKAMDLAGNSVYGPATLRVYKAGTFVRPAAIPPATEEKQGMLITAALVLAAILAIILTILKRRKK
jgi:hypothetical protein